MKDFAFRLIEWYYEHKRDLPWRHTKDPYAIWLSEVILQQTRVNQGLPYYLKFLAAYPSIQDLAAAEEKDILRLWQGLGYYSRARNMHHAAKTIVAEYAGEFPTSYKKLKKLKGIGDYTAAAIASFAFDEDVAVVDGNVFRVLSRVFGVEEDISSTKGKKIFTELANQLLPASEAAIYNQAIMEFGALHCKPTSPDCPRCIFKDTCVAFAQNKQTILPTKNKKIVMKKRHFYYLVIEHEHKFLLKERGEGDIWQGLYDFILLERTIPTPTPSLQDTGILPLTSQIFEQVLEQTFAGLFSEVPIQFSTGQEILLVRESSTYVHQLTHQTIYVQFWHLRTTEAEVAATLATETGYQYYDTRQIEELPKPILIDNFLKEYFPQHFKTI